MKTRETIISITSWFCVALFAAIGVINLFWGNDPEFGAFILILSLIYIPQVGILFQKISGFRIHWIVKLLVGIFILWAALGVGELFDKIDLMLMDLK